MLLLLFVVCFCVIVVVFCLFVFFWFSLFVCLFVVFDGHGWTRKIFLSRLCSAATATDSNKAQKESNQNVNW